jgi:hypothetical protein
MNENRQGKMPSHNIDELFRSAIEPAEERPAAAVWESVEKDLDRSNIINIKRKYNDLKKVAIVLVLILSSALVYEFENPPVLSGKGVARDGGAKSDAPENVTLNNQGKPSTQQRPTDSRGSITGNPMGKMPPATSRVDGTAGFNGDDEDRSPGLSVPSKSSANTSGSYQNLAQSAGHTPQHPVQQNPDIALSTAMPAPVKELKPANLANRTLDLLTGIQSINAVPFVNEQLLKSGAGTQASKTIKLAKRHSSLALSLVFSPDFTSRLVKADWPVNREDNRDEIRKSERFGFSYSFGALLDYKLKKHWAVETGFTLSRAVINIDPKFIFARRDDLGDVKYKFNSSSGYSYLSPHTLSRPAFGDSLHAFGSTSSLTYVSIPLAAKYKISKKKVDYFVSAGAAANILVKEKIETSLVKGANLENAVNRDIRGLKPVYYSALLSAGASYNITKSLAVNFSPTARLALTSINKDAPVKSYQQSLGLVAGVQFNF